MVAIFTGRTLGLETGSAAVLGDRGLTGFIGNPLLGRAGEGVQVNAYTGDLVLQRQDEFLVGKGLDAAFVQTYNSLSQGSGVPIDENGDRWRQNYDRRIYGGVFATNATPTTGSQVFRVGGDGAEVAYSWNGSKFVASDGAGAYDTLEHVSSTWVWTDGDTQVKEVYYDNTVTPAALAGKLASQSDADGNTILLTYETNGNRLLSIQTAGYLTDAGGANVLDGSGNPIPLGTITLSYNSGTNDIAKIVTKYVNLGVAGTPQQTQVSTWYDYDTSTAQHRLTAIKTDLTPGDLSIVDGATYNINYTYDTSGRITGIIQTDGSSLAISYDASGRVYQLTQAVASGVSRTTTLTYAQSDANGTYTKVTDAAGLDTKLYYATTGNNIGNLSRVTMPQAVTGAAAQTVQFFYDANGNVTQYIDAQGRSTSWTAYDANGNWLTRVSQGVSSGTTTTTRTYGANNELKTETSKASDDATVYGVSTTHTTRYVYDAEWHLRYTIGALGEVKEFQYTAAGQLATEVGYPEHTYDLTGLAGTDAPTEAQMNAWRNALTDRSSTEISAYTYDQRGNLLTSIDYGAASTAGAASTGNGTTQYTYVYDQEGRLISKVAGDPAAPVPQAAATYVYDGLGRAISSTGADGGVTTVSFQDKSSTTVVKLASGLVQTSVYNLAGELVAQVDSQGNLEPDLANASQYWLSNVTRTAATAIAGNPAYLYTTTASGTSGSTGGVLQAVDPNEMFVFEITLKAGGGTTGNTNARLGIYGATSAWGANADSTATIVSGPGTLTQSSGSLFDITNLSATTETRVRIVRRFAVADTARPQLYAGNSGTGAVAGDTIIASAPSVELSPGHLYDKLGRLRVVFDHSGNASYALYDGASRKTGAIAADGSLVEYKYDTGNHVVATVKYATRVTAANLTALLDPNTALGIADIRPADTASDEWNWNVYDT
ncbi:RHS repeat protein [Novosphingobium sp. AAP93]|uniref:RHS repeat protein n=1 Tax=Novosphingobium sp. AAP93 TaxID=1523427 RepID=UPI0006B98044|nr:RHS repeat protein [Novosphingobium sp. AAP93]KPF77596.1 hypothetical protein IP83_19435 [Novosphingobium sp. AAP93]